MFNELIFDGLINFQIITAVKAKGNVFIDIESRQMGCNCPFCYECSFRIHSYYIRTILDLPLLGNETWIRLKTNKYYCRNDYCSMKVFTERFDIHFKSGKRMTEMAREKI